MQHRGGAAFLRKTCVTSNSFERHLGELPYQRPMASRFANDTGVQIANPVSFLAQKILIHGRRNRVERAKDILYMHDTIETFATRIDDLSAEWVRNIRHELHANSVRAVESAAATLFGAVTDSIRSASRIVKGRRLTPEAIRETCNVGFTRIFQPIASTIRKRS